MSVSFLFCGASFEIVHLRSCEIAPFSGGQVAQLQLADGNAAKAKHCERLAFAHLSDLAVAALEEGHTKHGGIVLDRDQLGLDGQNAVAVDLHGGGQGLYLLGGDGAADLDVIDLGDLVLRVGEAVGQLAVVGQKEKSLRVHIKTAYGVETHARIGHKLGDGGAPTVVGDGGQIAAGLVEHDVGKARLFRGRDHLTAVFHAVACGIDLLAYLGHDSVDLDPTFFNFLFGRAAGQNAAVGEEFLNSYRLGFHRFLYVTRGRKGT